MSVHLSDRQGRGSRALWLVVSAAGFMTAPASAYLYEVKPGGTYTEVHQIPWECVKGTDQVKIYYRDQPYKSKWELFQSGVSTSQRIVIEGVPDATTGRRPVIDGQEARPPAVKTLGTPCPDGTTNPFSDTTIINADRAVMKIGNLTDRQISFVTVKNLEFRGARGGLGFYPSINSTTLQNYESSAAGLWIQFGKDILVENSRFVDNLNGIQTNVHSTNATAFTENITIRKSEFYDQAAGGSTDSHSLYLQGRTFLVENNLFVMLGCCQGNQVKTRASDVTIRYNKIVGGDKQLDFVEAENPTIRAEQKLDQAGKGRIYVYGNTLIELPGGPQPKMIHVGWDSGALAANADEGPRRAIVYNNAFLDYRQAGAAEPTTIVFLQNQFHAADLWNNYFWSYGSNGSLALCFSYRTANGTVNWGKNYYQSANFRLQSDNIPAAPDQTCTINPSSTYPNVSSTNLGLPPGVTGSANPFDGNPFLGLAPASGSVLIDQSAPASAFLNTAEQSAYPVNLQHGFPADPTSRTGTLDLGPFELGGDAVPPTQPTRLSHLALNCLNRFVPGYFGSYSATATVTLTTPAPAGGTNVGLSSSNTTWLTVPASVNVPPGSTRATFTFNTPNVLTTMQNVTITASLLGEASAQTIRLGPPSLYQVNMSPASVSGGSPSTGTVSLEPGMPPAPAGGLVMNLSSNNAAVTVPSTMTIPAGQTSGTFNATTSSVSNTVVATITATDPNWNYGRNTTLTVTPGSGPPTGAPTRINSGGDQYTDGAGAVWSADYGIASGTGLITTTNTIAGTSDQALYQNMRTNSGTLLYRLAIANGTYSVKLKFAELYQTAAGERVFNIKVNGTTVESNFDIWVQAGNARYKAVDKVYTATVSNGLMAIEFVGVAGGAPGVNAIEITPTSLNVTTFRVNAGGGDYTDPQGNLWVDELNLWQNTGTTYLATTTNAITNTSQPGLYQNSRIGEGTVTYRFSVTNGTHTVKLRFAELTYDYTGLATQNILINGTTVQTALDVRGEAGAKFKALDKTYTVAVTNGQIKIDIVKTLAYCQIAGIEITPQ